MRIGGTQRTLAGSSPAVEVAAGQLQAAPAQRLVALAGGRAPAGLAALQPAHHLVDPAEFLGLAHPARDEHDDGVALTAGADHALTTGTAPDLDDRGVRHRSSLAVPERAADVVPPSVVHRPRGLWTDRRGAGATPSIIERMPTDQRPPHRIRPCPPCSGCPRTGRCSGSGTTLGCSGSTRTRPWPWSGCHPGSPRCWTSWPSRSRRPRCWSGRSERGAAPEVGRAAAAATWSGSVRSSTRPRCERRDRHRADSDVVVSGDGPLAVGMVLGLVQAGVGAVYTETAGPVLAGGPRHRSRRRDRGRDRVRRRSGPRCAGSARRPTPRGHRRGWCPIWSCWPTRWPPTRSGCAGCTRAGTAHLPVRMRDGIGRGRSAGAARSDGLPALPRAAALRPRPELADRRGPADRSARAGPNRRPPRPPRPWASRRRWPHWTRRAAAGPDRRPGRPPSSWTPRPARSCGDAGGHRRPVAGAGPTGSRPRSVGFTTTP